MQLTIRNLGIAAGALMAGAMGIAMIFTWSENSREKAALAQAVDIARAVDASYRALIPLSLERSVTQVGLSLDQPLPASFAGLRREQQEVSNRALDELTRLLQASADPAKARAQIAAIAALRAELAELRRRADQALGTARAQRAAGVENLPAQIIDVVMRTNATLVRSFDSEALSRANIHPLVQAASHAWRVREFEGQARTFLAIAALHQRPLSAGELERAAFLSAKASAAAEMLGANKDNVGPAGREAIERLERDFGQTYANLRQQMLQAAAHGRYPLSFEDFFRRSSEAMASIERTTLTLAEQASRASAAAAAAITARIWTTLAVEALLMAMALFVTWLLVFRIARRMTSINLAMSKLAEGDTGGTIGHQQDRDEIGDMARALAVFRDNALRMADLDAGERERQLKERRQALLEQCVGDFNATVTGVLQMLANAAHDMQHSAGAMSEVTKSTEQEASRVDTAASNGSTNLSAVAAACEEMLVTVAEIGRQAAQSAEVADLAQQEARHADREVSELVDATRHIGEVVRMISDIARQTNLLALNATIEAARAGEAGRGFAIVAAEVKNLAAQTASATEGISAKIAAIQAATRSASQSMERVAGVIGDVTHSTGAIAEAVRQQQQSTEEIVRNVQDASGSMGQVSKLIGLVSRDVKGASKEADRVLGAADLLAQQSAGLRTEVENFLAAVAKADERRLHERIPCDLPATIRVNGRTAAAIIRDLSPGGARVSSEVVDVAGTELTLSVPGLEPVSSRIARCKDGQLGLVFKQDAANQAVALKLMELAQTRRAA